MTVTPDGRLVLSLHKGQSQAWRSTRRFILILAGIQSGKTSFEPHWLRREIATCGPGDYLVVGPTEKLLDLKCLPEFKALFQATLKLGQYRGSPIRRIEFSTAAEKRIWGKAQDVPTRIIFGHGSDPDSLASATCKAAVLDEAGQNRFRYGSWLAVLARLALARGRVLLGTTPYCLGWMKQELHDRALAGDPEIELVGFSSLANPAFSREEYLDRKRRMPAWLFDLNYRGVFTRPAGAIYGNFDETRHKCKRFEILPQWRRYLGLDFGGVNTAAVYFAEDPRDKRLYIYKTYHAGERTAKQHVQEMMKGEPGIPYCVGGSKSEGQWRAEFSAAGLPVNEPAFHEVDVGILRVWEAINENKIVVFDDLIPFLDQLQSYSRETDDAGNVSEEIEDKDAQHWCDCIRYLLGWYMRGQVTFLPKTNDSGKSAVAKAPPGVFSNQKLPNKW